MSQGFYYVIVTAYLPELGVDPTAVGLILGVSAASVVLSAIPMGVLSDRRGRKRVFLISMGGAMVTLFLIGFAPGKTLAVAPLRPRMTTGGEPRAPGARFCLRLDRKGRMTK